MKTGLIAERLFSGTKSITFDFYENPVFLKGIKLKRFDNVLENQFSSYVEKRGVKSLRFTGFISSFYCFALLFRDYELTHDERSIFFRALQGLILVSLSGLTFMKKIRSKSTYLAMGGSFCILFLQAYMHHVKIVPPYALGNTVPLLIFAVAIGLGLSFNKSLLTNAGMILFMFGGAFVYNEAGYQINLVNILLNFGIATGIAFLDERELRIGFYRLQKVRELNKELEAADKAKLELLSVISHDITGPLTNLNSSIELKDSELLSDKDLKYIFKETNLKIRDLEEKQRVPDEADRRPLPRCPFAPHPGQPRTPWPGPRKHPDNRRSDLASICAVRPRHRRAGGLYARCDAPLCRQGGRSCRIHALRAGLAGHTDERQRRGRFL